MKIAIISACRNEIGHIRNFFECILAQELDGVEWEVVIADGMSNDGTREVLRQYAASHPRLNVIDNRGRIVSTGLNAAIRAAQGEIILRMDAHTRYAPDYVRRCVEALEQTCAENVGGPCRTEAHGLQARAVAAAYHSGFSTGGAKFHDPAYEGFVDTVPYGCWRRETLIRLGLFDETLVRNQDDELNLRLIRAGGRIWQTPRVLSWYSPRSTISALFRQYFQYGFWKVAVIRKHKLAASWRHLVPIAFILGNLLLLAGAVVGLANGPNHSLFQICACLWLASIGAYAILNLIASAITASRNGWVLFPYLPAVFGAYHFSWGLGFLMALLRSPQRQRRGIRRESLFTRITR